MRGFGILSPKWDDFIKALPGCLMIYEEEKVERLQTARMVDDSKETVSSRPNGTEAIRSDGDRQGTQDCRRCKSDDPSTERTVW